MKTKMLCSLTKLSIIFFIALNFMCNLSKAQNEIEELENTFLKDKKSTNETKDSQKTSSVIPEINDVEGLKKFFVENKKFIFEVYSSSCPHCIKLAPELEKLASMYKDTVKFVKTDGRDSYAYRSFVKVDHFPTLFIYDNGNLIELGGSLSFESVKKYIDEKYFFNCEKIKSIEALQSKITELANKRFFIGILDEANLKKGFELFYKLMDENMLIVENCFYFPHNTNNIISDNNVNTDNDSKNNENQKFNFLNFFSTLKNFILINNSEKINVYEDLDYLVDYPLQHQNATSLADKKGLELAVSSLSKSAKNYFFDNSYASVIKFTKKQINLIYQNPKLRAVFSYDRLSKDAVLGNLRKFVAQRKNVENYNIMEFDIDADSKEFDDEEKMYLFFTRVPGVHFTNQNLENIFNFNLNSLDIFKINEFADDNYAKYKAMLDSQNNSLGQSPEFNAEQGRSNAGVNNNNNNKAESKANDSNGAKSNGNVNGFGVEKKFVTAKIVEKLDQINYDEKGNIKELHSENDINYTNKYNKDKINKNQEKNKLTEDYVNGKNKNNEEELSKKIGSVLANENNGIGNTFDSDKAEDSKKHEIGVNKIKILLIYFVIYCAIYYLFYMRVSKRDESKYN